MAAKKRKYRKSFMLPNGKRGEYTAHTQAEAASVVLNVNKLISAQKTGSQNIDATEWALKLSKGTLRNSLIRWGLMPDTRDSERTLKDLYQIFVVEGKEKPRTLKNRQNCFNNLFQFFGEDCLLRDIDRQRAEEFIKYLEREGNAFTGKGLGENTLGGRIKRFKQFFRFACEESWISENPFIRFKAVSKANKDRWQYITRDDVLKVIQSTPNREHRLIIALVRFCGLRGASELSRLTFDASCFHPSDATHSAELLVHSTKVERHEGHETRTIPLIPEVEQLVLDLWETIPEGENRFFPKMKATTNIGVVVKKIFKRFGVELGQMYNLRRSFVSDLMQGGLHEQDPAMFELLAGHDVKVSLQHYQILSNRRKERAADKFMEIMSAPTVSPTPAHNFAHGNNSKLPETCNAKNGLSLENPELLQETKKPCKMLQGKNLPQVGFEPITLGSEELSTRNFSADENSTIIFILQGFMELSRRFYRRGNLPKLGQKRAKFNKKVSEKIPKKPYRFQKTRVSGSNILLLVGRFFFLNDHWRTF